MKERILNYRPAVLAGLACAIGILTAAASIHSFVWIALLILLALGCIACIIFKKYKVFLFLIFALVTFSGFVIAWAKSAVPELDVKDKYINARVCSIEKERDGATVYILEDVSYDVTTLQHKTLLICPNGAIFNVGDEIAVFGKIASIEANIFNSYDANLLGRDIRYQAESDFTVFSKQGELRFFENIKSYIYADFDKHLLFDTKGIASSLLFGERALLSISEAESFKVSGLSHIFAVSGLHTAFFATMLFFLFKKLSLSPKLTFVLTLLILLFYGALAGFVPSVNRAIIMTMVTLGSTLVYKRVDPLSALCSAGVLILLFKPFNLFDISFLLSFSAVAGIAIFYSGIRQSLLDTDKLGNFSSSSIALSLSANSLLLPIIVNVFKVFALYFCLANLIVLPLVTLAFVLLLLSISVNAILPFMGVLYKIASFPLVALRGLSAFIARLPFAQLSVSNMGIITFFYLAVMLLNSKFFMLPKDKKLRYTVVLIFACVILVAIL